MRLLVTGASGFVGRAVLRNAAERGWCVRAAVRSPSSPRPPHAHEHVVADLGSADWTTAVHGVDAIIHLAARVHVMRDRSGDPLSEFRRVNVLGTERLAQAAAAAGVHRFVLVSTVKVHGEERDEAYRESDAPAPGEPYGHSKLEAERAVDAVATATGLGVVVVRPPLVYGPGVRANFRAMLKAVDRGIPLPLANVRNRRSMIYVENLADALLACAADARAAGRTYLVSDGEDLSTPEMLRTLAGALGRPSRLFPAPPGALWLARRLPRFGAAARRLIGSLTVDLSKIQAELGWRAPVPVSVGLADTARWFLDRGGGE
nr:NAD-dependent epimerase/dehydratase family protein [Anaeromyxobacter dehalogenans]